MTEASPHGGIYIACQKTFSGPSIYFFISHSSTLIIMHSQAIIIAFALFMGLVSSVPSTIDNSGEDLVRRGMSNDTCVECPPPPWFNCTTGCISIECQGCEGKEDCCKCIGLDTERHVCPCNVVQFRLTSSSCTTQILWWILQIFESTHLSLRKLTSSNGVLMSITYIPMVKS